MKYQGITIHKTPGYNTWYTRYRANGVQHFISAKTQKECYNKLKKALKQAEQRPQEIELQQTSATNITLNEWYNKWLELYKIGKVKQTTLVDYKSILTNVSEELKNKEISAIKVEDILQSLNKCPGERQRQKLYDFYNMLFKKAEDNEYISKNIMKRIDKPKHEKQHGIALDNTQQEELERVCPKVPNSDIVLVAMYQGLRRGEALGLTIDNIDFENNLLTINKAWTNGAFDTTKNKQSVRTMPLFDKTKQILLKYQNKKGRVFNLSVGEYQTIKDKIKKLIKIPNLKIKDMRSTFITRCKELNIPKHVIQSWVGHIIGSSVTDTVYTKHNADIDFNYINIINKSNFNTKLYSNSTHKKK